jgi:hypothetical protein
MFHSFVDRVCLSIVLVVTFYSASAQNSNKENSPYSRYGIGELRNQLHISLRGMGGISSAYTNPYTVNSDNPATYSFLKLTTYDAAGEGSIKNIRNDSVKYTTGMATVSYFSIGFPVSKNAGISFGLRPYSRVYYKLDDTATFPGFGYGYKRSWGEGSLNYGYIGAAGKYKGLSVGANFGYLFGTVTNYNYIVAIGSAPVASSDFQRTTRVGGIYWKGGALYDFAVKKDLSMHVGATATLSQILKAKRSEYWISHPSPSVSDTAYAAPEVRGTIITPLSYSAGVQLERSDKWLVGIDFSGAQWSQFRSFGIRDSVANAAWKLAVGGAYTPNATDIRSYFQRITYRIGFYYGIDNVLLRNTDLSFYAATIGMSLPLRKGTDRIHTALEIGNRGTTANGLLRENFTKLSIGISLNDRWFIKRKYE